MTIRVPLATAIVAVVFAALGAAMAAGLMVWQPWDDDYQRQFTGAEAAALVFDRENIRLEDELDRLGVIFFDCQADDFNERLKAWIVVCKFGEREAAALAADATFRFYDETEDVDLLLEAIEPD